MSVTDPALLTAIGAVAVAIVSGVFAWASGRPKNRTDYAAVIQEGFAALLKQMQEQHEEDQKEICRCNSVVEDLSDKVRELTVYIGKLEFFLRAKGLWEEAPQHNLVGIPRISNGKN